MIKLKKISCAVMSFVMLFAMSTSVFAAEKTTEDFSTPQKSIVCQTNLDEMDLSKLHFALFGGRKCVLERSLCGA